MGPTAMGKTELAVELVQRFPFEIISVDSAMVYRDMDIGTAKPTQEVLSLAPHRLIDILDPAERYSAGRFRDDALAEMKDVTERGRIPLLVGGTMLYFRALGKEFSELPSADPGIRAKLEQDAERSGWGGLHQRLQDIDPVSAKRIHCNDPQRIQRALEIYEITGCTLTQLQSRDAGTAVPYKFTKLALLPSDRDKLYQRIELRFQEMLAQGFLAEVASLHSRDDLHADLPSMRAVGYRQAWQFLDGELGELEWVQRGLVATRQYA